MLSTDAGNGCTTLRPSLQADFLVIEPLPPRSGRPCGVTAPRLPVLQGLLSKARRWMPP